jgi:arylsulfatase A-like enzyme
MPTKRRVLLAGAAAAAATAGAVYVARRPTTPPRADLRRPGQRMNVLLIVTDQERAWELLPAGFIDAHCPARARLRERGVYFSNMQAPSQLCSMARGILYTGAHPQTNGVWENVPVPYASNLHRDVPTLGTMFQDAGFRTAYFGKWHITRLHERKGGAWPAQQVRDEIAAYGFPITDNDVEYDGPWYGHEYDARHAASAARFFEATKGDKQPWFAAVNIVNPHDVMYYTSGDEMTRSRKVQFPDRSTRPPDTPLYRQDLGYAPLPELATAVEADAPDAVHEYGRVMSTALGVLRFDDTAIVREFQNYYFNCLRDSDRHIDSVLRALDASGQADRTVIAFVSDHGEMLGAHGLRGKGSSGYREATQVPMIVAAPGGARGARSSALLSQVDLAPTLLSLAGVSVARAQQAYPTLIGKDFSALAQRADGAGPRETEGALVHWTAWLFQDHLSAIAADEVRRKTGLNPIRLMMIDEVRAAMHKRSQMRGIVRGGWKFMRYFSPRDHHTPGDWDELSRRNDLALYDLGGDPAERRNLAREAGQKERVVQLNAALNALVASEVGIDDGRFMPGPRLLWSG